MTASFRVWAALDAAVALSVPVNAQIAPSWRGANAPDTPIRTTPLPPSGAAPASEIADRYLERARTDRRNADLWVYCAAAALKRGVADEIAADAYARNVAITLKAMLSRSATSPCEDAIPAHVWDGSADTPGTPAEDAASPPDPGALTFEEEERQRRMNAEADAREQARAATQASVQQRRADAQARYDRERAQYEEDLAASKIADAEYQRQLAAHRSELESGKYPPR